MARYQHGATFNAFSHIVAAAVGEIMWKSPEHESEEDEVVSAEPVTLQQDTVAENGNEHEHTVVVDSEFVKPYMDDEIVSFLWARLVRMRSEILKRKIDEQKVI